MSSIPGFPSGPAALVIAHPGHELRVHHWLERARPEVFVLTDGSGGAGEGRLGSTTGVLSRAGAKPGSIYGRFADKQFYAAIMAGEMALFTGLVRELAEALVASDVRCVAGDAVEGYNPSHDLCRVLIGAAVDLAGRELGRSIPNVAFNLVGAPDVAPPGAAAIRVTLDEPALDRKLQAAHGYPELAHEVEAAIGRAGARAFATECFWPVGPREGATWTAAEPPYYERFGAARVAAGQYARLLTFAEHLAPIAAAVWACVDEASPAAR